MTSINDIAAIILVGSGRPLELLAECLDSLELQTVPVQEILVVLNGVALSEEVRYLCNRHSARVLVLPEDLGCPEGRNAGASATSMSILLFVDDDGRLDAHAVANVSNIMEAGTCVALAGRVIESPEDEQRDDICPKQQLRRPAVALPTAYFSGGIFAIRREVFLERGGYWKDSRRQGEELDLALKLFKNREIILYDVGLVLYHPTRLAAPSSSISVATSASGVRVFVTHFPLPIALAAYVWKLGRHAFWLISRREPGILHLISAVTQAALRGWSQREPMTFSEAMKFRQLTRQSPNIPATRFSLMRVIKARLPRHPPFSPRQ